MQSKMLGRACAAGACLLTLLAPTTAFASWWDGGYDGGYHSSWDAPRPPGPAGPLYGCENSTLPGTGSGLLKTTTPPPGTPVQPGDEILVEITWRVRDWIGPDLHKAIDCVYINGVFAPELSGGERPTPNDGHFAFHYYVPLDVPPGSTICDQGFVSGPNGIEDFGREVSNVVCFPVDTSSSPPPPPPCCIQETMTTTTAPEEEAEPYTESVRFEQELPPEAVPPTPAVLPRDVLPRTGGNTAPVRLAAGALALAALAGKVRRRAYPPQR